MDMIRICNGLYDRDGFRLSLDLSVARGSFVAVLGPSGAGKSTLLNIIAGFETLVTGVVMLASEDHSSTPPSARPVSFVFQDNNSFAHLTARQNVALGILPSLKLSSSQWQATDDALDQVGIAHLAARKPGDMSGGERQRIALARVLVRQKPILLLDEAFAALGPALRDDMLDLVKTMQRARNLTILMVTHQPEDARRVSDQVIFVDQGKVHAPVELSTFFDGKNEDVAAYLGDG